MEKNAEPGGSKKTRSKTRCQTNAEPEGKCPEASEDRHGGLQTASGGPNAVALELGDRGRGKNAL